MGRKGGVSHNASEEPRHGTATAGGRIAQLRLLCWEARHWHLVMCLLAVAVDRCRRMKK